MKFCRWTNSLTSSDWRRPYRDCRQLWTTVCPSDPITLTWDVTLASRAPNFNNNPPHRHWTSRIWVAVKRGTLAGVFWVGTTAAAGALPPLPFDFFAAYIHKGISTTTIAYIHTMVSVLLLERGGSTYLGISINTDSNLCSFESESRGFLLCFLFLFFRHFLRRKSHSDVCIAERLELAGEWCHPLTSFHVELVIFLANNVGNYFENTKYFPTDFLLLA